MNYFLSMNTKTKEKSLFSKKLVKLRQEKGLTQKELADRLNTSVKNISYFENISSNPTTKTLKALASFFWCPRSLLLEENTKHKPGHSSLLEDKISKIKQLPLSTKNCLSYA